MKKKAKKKAAPKRQTRAAGSDKDHALREHLVYLLKGGGAHIHFMDSLEGLPAGKRGTFAQGLAHTAWQLLEHVRLAQWDILEFSRNPKHVSPEFPDGYWPKTPIPPSDEAWEQSVVKFQDDLEGMIRLVENPKTYLFARIPHGQRQTILREALLLADHNSYHLGQLVDLRRALGVWQSE